MKQQLLEEKNRQMQRIIKNLIDAYSQLESPDEKLKEIINESKDDLSKLAGE